MRSFNNKFSHSYESGIESCFDVICNDGKKRIAYVKFIQIRFQRVTWNTNNLDTPFLMKVISGDGYNITNQYYKYYSNGLCLYTEVCRFPNGVDNENYEALTTSESMSNYKGKSIYEIDSYGVKKEYGYDDFGNLIYEQIYGNNGTKGERTEYRYDDEGQ